tara:strand:+ start:166 stop:717 length:552 start_codon:yes stop_codon:yes gene_type:complete
MSGSLKVGGSELINDNGGSGSLNWGTGVPAGSVIKKTYYSIGRGTMANDSFPNDDTIPQRDEGAEIFSQAYTPSTTNCTIIITTYVRISESSNVGAGMQLGLFISDSDDALIVGEVLTNKDNNPNGGNITLMYSMSGWSGSKTLSLRSSGGNTYNYSNEDQAYATQKFGSAFTSAFIVEEIAT